MNLATLHDYISFLSNFGFKGRSYDFVPTTEKLIIIFRHQQIRAWLSKNKIIHMVSSHAPLGTKIEICFSIAER